MQSNVAWEQFNKKFPILLSSGPGSAREYLLDANTTLIIGNGLEIQEKVERQIYCRDPFTCAGPEVRTIVISGNEKRRIKTMQKFTLKKWTDKEIVTSSLPDLEQLFQAIQDGESFILACEGRAKVIVGSNISSEITLGNIILEAEY